MIFMTPLVENQVLFTTAVSVSALVFTPVAPAYLLKNHCAQQSLTTTHQASDRNPFMHLQCVHLKEGKHALEAS